MLVSDYPRALSQAGLMRGRLERVGGRVTLELVGEFDLASREAFTATMLEIEATNPHAIVVDLRELTFMDASGIRSLLEARLRADGTHSFAVLNGSGPAHRTLELAGLDEFLQTLDAREAPPVAA